MSTDTPEGGKGIVHKQTLVKEGVNDKNKFSNEVHLDTSRLANEVFQQYKLIS